MEKKVINPMGIIQLGPLLAYRESWKELEEKKVPELAGPAEIPIHYVGEVRLIIKKAFRPDTCSKQSETLDEDLMYELSTTAKESLTKKMNNIIHKEEWYLVGEIVQEDGNIPILLSSLREDDPVVFYILLNHEEAEEMLNY